MTAHEAKVRFRVGSVELEYQGPAAYIEDGLIELLEKVLSYRDDDVDQNERPREPTPNRGEESGRKRGNHDISLATMISRLGGKTGPDVVFMSAAHLALCQNRGSFSRAEILENAKTAVGHYKKSISGNLTSYLRRLLADGRLSQHSDTTYSLPERQRKIVENQLANAS